MTTYASINTLKSQRMPLPVRHLEDWVLATFLLYAAVYLIVTQTMPEVRLALSLGLAWMFPGYCMLILWFRRFTPQRFDPILIDWYIRLWIHFLIAALWFDTLSLTILKANANDYAEMLMAWDNALGGRVIWSLVDRYAGQIPTGMFFLFYASMFLFPATLMLWLARRGRGADGILLGQTVIVACYIGFAIHMLFPARPLFATMSFHDSSAFPYYRQFLAKLVVVNRNSFPSLHVALATIFTIIATRTGGKIWLWVPIGTAIIISTIYLRQHFLVDIPAGIALAIFSIALVSFIHRQPKTR